VDSLTAFVALFTIVASNFLEHARWLDPVGGLIISGMIVQAGWSNTKAAVLELADASVDADVRESAHAAAAEFIASHGATIRGVQGIKSGQNLMFDVEVVVPEDWSVAQCDQVGQELRQAIATKVRGTRRVVVRFTTKETEAFQDEFVAPSADENVPETPEEHADGLAGHDHAHQCDGGKHAHANGHAANGTAQKRK
jgi:divalent metal cation (Fe/Co/Zn/Cd) transporter